MGLREIGGWSPPSYTPFHIPQSAQATLAGSGHKKAL